MNELVSFREASNSGTLDRLDLALLPMQEEALPVFAGIEDSLEYTAEVLLQRYEVQAAADTLIEAATAYEASGFLFKAGTLKRRAAKAYRKIGHLDYAVEYIGEAILLIRQADQLRKMVHEINGLNLSRDALRASYPNLYVSYARYNRNEIGNPSSNLTFFQQMEYAYADLLSMSSELGGKTLAKQVCGHGNKDLFDIHPEFYAERKRYGRLFKPIHYDWIGDINSSTIRR